MRAMGGDGWAHGARRMMNKAADGARGATRALDRSALGGRLIDGPMDAWARRAGARLASWGSRRAVVALWAASALWGAATQAAMVAVAAPLLMPIDFAGMALERWGRGEEGMLSRPAEAGRACARLAGVLLRLAASGALWILQGLRMWAGGAFLAQSGRACAARAVESSPEWAPRGALWAWMGMNAFDLVARRHGSIAAGGRAGLDLMSDLARVEAMGYRGLGSPGLVRRALMPVGLAGAVWGVGAPCAPGRSPLRLIREHLDKCGGPTPKEAQWLSWAQSLGEARGMEEELFRPEQAPPRSRGRRL